MPVDEEAAALEVVIIHHVDVGVYIPAVSRAGGGESLASLPKFEVGELVAGKGCMGAGRKWGKPYANQCPLMPNGALSSFVNKTLQPLLFGAVGFFALMHEHNRDMQQPNVLLANCFTILLSLP